MKEIMDLVVSLVETAGPVAAGIVAVLAIMFVGLKWSGVGFTIGSRTTLVDDGKFDAVAAGVQGIADKIESVERRVTAVEQDVETRATREEVHEIKLAIAESKGQMAVLGEIGRQTRSSVERIEGYMLEIGMAQSGRRRRDD